MYEHQTFQAILSRMLSRVPDDIDKREGSIIYDALAPAAAELAQAYAELEVNHRLFHADTASGEYLTRRCAEFGVERLPATKARREGRFYGAGDAPFDVPVGSRFSAGGLTYMVVSRLDAGRCELECETAGAVGNQQFGPLLPIDTVPGLVRAELGAVLIPGEDEESDEALRQRFFTRVRQPSAGGNVADYIRWALEVPGVGGVSVVPVKYGPGTVSVAVIDAEHNPASPELVAAVQAYIAPDGIMGGGKAPIGADVRVESATPVPINISATLTIADGYVPDTVRASVTQRLDEYLKSIPFGDDDPAQRVVRYVRIGQTILDTSGVLDYSGLTVNGGTANVQIGKQEVAVLGTVSLT